ncbi:MAG: ABC transporter ATP-binding protein [Pseudomonadota bacterium]
MLSAIDQLYDAIRALFRLLDRTMRLQIGFLIGLSLLNMLIEIAAMLSVVMLLFYCSDSGFSMSDQKVFRFLSGVFGKPVSVSIPGLIVMIIAAYALKNLLRVLELYRRARLSELASTRFSTRLLSIYLWAPYTMHLKSRSTELIDAVWRTSDLTVRAALDSFMRLAGDGLMTLGILVILVPASPGSTLAFAFGLGVVCLLLLRLLHEHFGRFGLELREQFVTLLHLLQNAFYGISEVKLFQQEKFFEQRYAQARGRMERLYVADGVYRFLPQITLEFMFVTAFGVLGLFAYLSVERTWILPVLGTYAFCGIRLLPSSYKILEAINQLRTEGPLLMSLYDELNLLQNSSAGDDETEQRLMPALPLQARDLSFAYNGCSEWRMAGICLEVESGHSYAIVGESGSGKTTLLHLLAGLLEPGGGDIILPAGRLADVRRSWQRCVGYVAQEPFILDDTLQTNIVLDDQSPDPERLRQVLAAARLQEWVDTLPQGLATQAGERGRHVSGGQRQRIAIARALYKQPDILFFDEPTSALDVVTERALEDALLNLKSGVTRVIVTHRLETARRCDHIFYLENGRLVGSGDFVTLFQECAGFARIAQLSAGSGSFGKEPLTGSGSDDANQR